MKAAPGRKPLSGTLSRLSVPLRNMISSKTERQDEQGGMNEVL